MKGKDLTGLRVGKLTVIAPTDKREQNAIVWHCRCDCGNEIDVSSRKLSSGVAYSCGCQESPLKKIGKDLTGLHFGKLTVLGQSGDTAKGGNTLWLCQCECGNKIETTRHKLISGSVRSCGCGRKQPLKDWIGKRFGMLTVVSYVGKENGFHIWHCRCDCGNEVDVRQNNLLRGWTTSCGCKRKPTKNFTYVEGTCVELLDPNKTFKSNTSGVRGVYFESAAGKWHAQICFRNHRYNLGRYSALKDAAKARAAAEEHIFENFLSWYEENYPKGKIPDNTDAEEQK